MAFNGIYIKKKKKHLINRLKSFEFCNKMFLKSFANMCTNFMIHSGMKIFYLYYVMLIQFFQNIIFYEIYLNSIFFIIKFPLLR